jgi:hypothetical protein
MHTTCSSLSERKRERIGILNEYTLCIHHAPLCISSMSKILSKIGKNILGRVDSQEENASPYIFLGKVSGSSLGLHDELSSPNICGQQPGDNIRGAMGEYYLVLDVIK